MGCGAGKSSSGGQAPADVLDLAVLGTQQGVIVMAPAAVVAGRFRSERHQERDAVGPSTDVGGSDTCMASE